MNNGSDDETPELGLILLLTTLLSFMLMMSRIVFMSPGVRFMVSWFRLMKGLSARKSSGRVGLGLLLGLLVVVLVLPTLVWTLVLSRTSPLMSALSALMLMMTKGGSRASCLLDETEVSRSRV